MAASHPQVRLGLPSKGRMEDETMTFLAECNLRVDKTNPRQYSARIPAMPEILVLFQRARDIARSVAAGDIDLGITGYDTVLDALGDDLSDIIVVHEALGYGECRLVVAVPDEWDDVTDLPSLNQKAQSTGGLRAATKHVTSAELFFGKHNLSEAIQVVSADGALEAAPAVGYAEMIVDITSTGTTLRDNRLKTIDGGTLVESQAVMIANRESLRSQDQLLETARHLLEFFEARLRARGQYLVMANMRGSSEAEIAERIFTQTDLGGLQGPTISPVATRDGQGGWYAINIIVSQKRLYRAIQQIRGIDGSGVVVTPTTFIFEERPERYQRLLRELGRVEASNHD
ncbi:MAG: ATP phosphoribosyltransferase [Chloroflexi bacterium]|nr:ATP phosphoribosyltransferase [Chloroflexota bacterium]